MWYKNDGTSLLAAFRAFIREQRLLAQGETTLLAVSGGVDSVVMSSLFYQAKLPFAIAHCHFGLRGAASDQDAAFVRQLAQQYGAKLYEQSFDTLAYAHKKKLSLQMAARELRYQWLEELCVQHAIDKVATAHHSNDSLETLLLNLTRGTGIAGLHGILPRQGRVIRPLIFADKAQLLRYAQVAQLAWREDASNVQDSYARNFVRNKVIPLLQALNPSLTATSRLTVERLGQVEAFFQEYTGAVRQQILQQHGAQYYLVIQQLQDKPWAPVVLAALLEPFGFGFAQLRDLLRCSPQPGKWIASPNYQLYVDRSRWIITPHVLRSQCSYTIAAAADQVLVTRDHRLRLRVIPRAQYTIIPDGDVAALDLALLRFPLTIRKWQPGDYFYPLGMRQRKKLSDFLVDCKVPMPLKGDIYVMLSGDELVWVMGYRIDGRFSITTNTQMVYEARLMPCCCVRSLSPHCDLQKP
ncbi:MAG: tRNA lysidine(34) synthetase TilS [Bacteroidota bacterium]